MKWAYWPRLQDELAPHLSYLKGKVLNAGGGHRSIIIPNSSEVINMDICPAEEVDVVGDLQAIPFPDESFDSILNVAVLEHVRRPWVVVRELHRVLKRGGTCLCVVPFFQPIHYVPTDYFRYTPDGISSLLEDVGFVIEKSLPTHTIWHTFGWMCEDLIKNKHWLIKLCMTPIAKLIFLLSKYSKQKSLTFPNALTIYAKKL